jgi:hypothetical protein
MASRVAPGTAWVLAFGLASLVSCSSDPPANRGGGAGLGGSGELEHAGRVGHEQLALRSCALSDDEVRALFRR